MSFILDALKKSETERQQQGNAQFAAVPVGAENPKAPRWLWVLSALLAINVLVLAVVLLRPDSPQATRESVPAAGQPEIAATEPARDLDEAREIFAAEPNSGDATFAQQVAVAREKQAEDNSQVAITPNTQVQQATVAGPAPGPSRTYIRSFTEARVQGFFQMSDLHIDIHVYSENAADRFVFINMNKYRHGSVLTEGPTVKEITPDGVILEYQGTPFMLPRE